MRRITAVIIVILASGTVTNAQYARPTSPTDSSMTPTAQQEVPIVTPPDIPSLTIEQLNRLPIDGLAYNATLAFLLRRAGQPTSAGASLAETSSVRFSPEELHPAIESTPSQYQVTTNSFKDIEATSLTTTYLGLVYTQTVAIQEYGTNSFANIAYRRDSNGTNYAQQSLPLPTAVAGWSIGYSCTADPVLRKAPSTVVGQNVANRVFCVGLANHDGVVGLPPYGIGVWYSDTAGQSWSDPIKVIEGTQANQYLDHPSIAVSQYSGTAGEVYVAYTKFNDTSNGASAEIHVARSTNEGASFTQDACASVDVSHNCVQGLYNSSQVMVDAVNGAIYVLWVDYSGRIRGSSSSNFGLTWSDSTTNSLATTPVILGNQRLHNNTIAGTQLVARYNAPQARIEAVWHAYDYLANEPCVVGARCTDIFLLTKSALTGWTLISLGDMPGAGHVSNAQDQFQPALDFDANGNVLIAYYSRKDDSNDNLYKMFSVIVSADGTSIQRAEEAIACSWMGCESDPAATNEVFPGFIGDYHDVVLSNEYGYFLNAFVARPSPFTSFEIFANGVWY